MDLDDVIRYGVLAYFILRGLLRVVKKVKKSAGGRAPAPASAPVTAERGASIPEPGRRMPADSAPGPAPVPVPRFDPHETLRERLSRIEARARRDLDDVQDLPTEIRNRLTSVIRDGALPEIEGYKAALTGEVELRVVPGRREIAKLEALLFVVETLSNQRRDANTRAILGDADALAEACYRPILDFAGQRGMKIAQNYPMTLLHRDGAAIHLAFLEYKLAPIALPPDVRTRPWWWPAIAHEIAHDFYVSVPGLTDDVVDAVALDPNVDDAPIAVGTPEFMNVLYSSWVEEMFADAVGALMIGPAYLRSMIRLFATPEHPVRAVAIGIDADGVLDPHPPRHLRVHLTEHFLERMGHGTRARTLRDEWDDTHGDPDALALPTPGGIQAIPLEPLLGFGEHLMDRLYDAELPVLAGHRLADVPGLEFGPAHETRANAARDRFLAGHAAAFDARSLIAAATEAALDEPERRDAIVDAMQKSIVGVGTGERIAKVRQLAGSPEVRAKRRRRRAAARGWDPTQPLTTARVVDAIIVGELLERPR